MSQAVAESCEPLTVSPVDSRDSSSGHTNVKASALSARSAPRRRRGKAKLPDTSPFSDLPQYLQDNEFITKGYRIDYSIRDTVTSLFRVHNETGNIWTHLIGAQVPSSEVPSRSVLDPTWRDLVAT